MSGGRAAPAWERRAAGGGHLVFPSLLQHEWVRHAVGADDPDRPGGGRDALLGALGLEACACVRLSQVHGSGVLAFGASGPPPPAGPAGRADGLTTQRPGLCLEIRVADCVPIFLVDPVRRAIGLGHAGWRGTLAGLAASLVKAMERSHGCSPRDLEAWIGPSICAECFEVGPEVAEPFERRFGAAALPRARHVDLQAANRIALLGAGLDPLRVEATGPCTACNPDLLHSHRASGGAPGRNLALLARLA